ncbi:hypothetical protein [Nocardioides panaciterrulae]|uniref:Uncharacterized protein n=1 Tax=Nocardioides panaciterrulae TaxID=661492 RepID=A0A7Y9E4V6_9ACTN|nr:hypothetical protein [Nocardioides panaciterrulae]NYD41160.1 hypothetical protein [Nocardioides panaciterrulae]
MAEKTAKSAKSAKTAKSAGAPAASTGAGTKKSPTPAPSTTVASAAELSEEVLKSVEKGQRAAIEAVRRFVDTVDEVIPSIGDRPSRRQTVIDAALDMADKLVTTQYSFLRDVVRDAGRTLGKPDETKAQ